MTNELVSATVFHWFLIILTAGFAGPWFVVDSIKLYRLRNGDRSDPVVRDKLFGYMIGIAIGAIGCIGCLLFQFRT
jgi:hypothetical protein